MRMGIAMAMVASGLTTLVPGEAHAQRGRANVALAGQGVDAMIADYMQAHDIPGITLAIVQAPYITRVVGYGQADPATGRLAAPRTLWNLGTMSRAYAAVALLQLVESGKVGLDDPVSRHVEGLPSSWAEIRLRHLLAHTSGLPDYTRQPAYRADTELSPAQVIALVRELPLGFEPGRRVASSATDTFLIAQVVERASGMPYEAFVTEHQFARLGLKDTTFASSLAAIEHEEVAAQGGKHRRFLSEVPLIDPAEPAVGTGPDGHALSPAAHGSWSSRSTIWSTAHDISVWDIGLAGELLLRQKDTRSLLFHGVALADGSTWPAHSGWRFLKHRGLMDIQGDAPGFSCYLARFTDPAELLCVTLCANREGVDLAPLARKIAGAFDPKLAPPADPGVMTSVESPFSVGETTDRLAKWLGGRGVTVSARIDHAAAAASKGLDLPPTQVLVFGNPAVGTHLMLSKPGIALDLPLRIAVWQEPDGTVWAGYRDIAALAREHGVTGQDQAIAAMAKGLAAAVEHATSTD